MADKTNRSNESVKGQDLNRGQNTQDLNRGMGQGQSDFDRNNQGNDISGNRGTDQNQGGYDRSQAQRQDRDANSDKFGQNKGNVKRDQY